MPTTLFGTSPTHRVWLATATDGLVASVATWALHFFVWRTTASLVVGPWVGLRGSPLFWVYTLLFDLSLVSHARAMFTDPGAVPPGAQPPPKELRAQHLDAEAGSASTAAGYAHRWCEACHAYRPCGCDGTEGGGWEKGSKYDFKKTGRWCDECKAYKPRKSHHNATTGRCVVKLDHWCPWVCNAIGIMNHKHFILFCAYHCCGCVVGLCLVASWVNACWTHGLLSERSRLALEAMNGLFRFSTGRKRDGLATGRHSAAFVDPVVDSISGAYEAAPLTEGGLFDGSTPAPTPLFFDAPFRGGLGDDGALLREGACAGAGVTVVALFMVELVFGCFTLYMVLGQVGRMRDGRTNVEFKKGITHAPSSEVSELWGAGPVWQRLVPSPVVLPPHLAADILGFEPTITPRGQGPSTSQSSPRKDGERGGHGEEGACGGGEGESDREGDGSAPRRQRQRRPGAVSGSALARAWAAWALGLRTAAAWGRLPAIVLCLNAALAYAV